MFAASLADELDFRTMGNERKVISARLVRELEGKTEVETPVASTALTDGQG